MGVREIKQPQLLLTPFWKSETVKSAGRATVQLKRTTGDRLASPGEGRPQQGDESDDNRAG